MAMKPSRRCFFLSILCATLLVGSFVGVYAFIFWVLHWNWSPWFTAFWVFFWVMCVVSFFKGFAKLEILWFMDRDWTAKQAMPQMKKEPPGGDRAAC